MPPQKKPREKPHHSKASSQPPPEPVKSGDLCASYPHPQDPQHRRSSYASQPLRTAGRTTTKHAVRLPKRHGMTYRCVPLAVYKNLRSSLLTGSPKGFPSPESGGRAKTEMRYACGQCLGMWRWGIWTTCGRGKLGGRHVTTFSFLHHPLLCSPVSLYLLLAVASIHVITISQSSPPVKSFLSIQCHFSLYQYPYFPRVFLPLYIRGSGRKNTSTRTTKSPHTIQRALPSPSIRQRKKEKSHPIRLYQVFPKPSPQEICIVVIGLFEL
ncbi:hypothetical protein P280DRAFT_113712 [Massarina eburnea CBS 473.64]|uniref:Uncharacterized protein n=1 Tax=Massarina eburnea CBS 473.64 TaxID=1395130 RepID=A0A6A6RNZ6_9PLEO|nr:hypothetical protein P280DRAFT_113712 [Massarina eburnea CBS 473.64]